MDDLSVQKDKATVTAILPDKTKLKGEVFLASYSESHYGHQKVADILEGEKVFIPLSLKDEGRVEFLNKDQIVIMEGELSTPEDEEKLSMGLYHIEKVKISFANSENFEGAMISEVPKERSRLSDCLNLEGKFISMIKNGRYFYLNKNMISRVESLKESTPAQGDQPEEKSNEPGIPDNAFID
ncbi:MAG: hypothetical protein OEV42_14335 [Deltaproteobacteria bacterium]|nr:hypothetical protein [Deltaproteobacteria bacterium]